MENEQRGREGKQQRPALSMPREPRVQHSIHHLDLSFGQTGTLTEIKDGTEKKKRLHLPLLWLSFTDDGVTYPFCGMLGIHIS